MRAKKVKNVQNSVKKRAVLDEPPFLRYAVSKPCPTQNRNSWKFQREHRGKRIRPMTFLLPTADILSVYPSSNCSIAHFRGDCQGVGAKNVRFFGQIKGGAGGSYSYRDRAVFCEQGQGCRGKKGGENPAIKQNARFD
jgi:hypothetical protein